MYKKEGHIHKGIKMARVILNATAPKIGFFGIGLALLPLKPQLMISIETQASM